MSGTRSVLTFALLVVAALAASTSAASTKSLPNAWPICKRSDPKLPECLRDATAVAVADLAERGAKSLGVPPIDPLHINQLDIDQGSGPVSIALNFKNLDIYGFKDAKVGLVQADLEKYTFKAPVTLEKANLKGDYTINGKILILPIRGSGKCDLKLERINATVEFIGKEVMKDGNAYLNLEEFLFVFDAGKVVFDFENLFNGNKELAAQMNVFLNENWEQILQELKPSIQEAFGIAFRDISNRMFSRVSLQKIFPQ